jgi:hypothetical protein
MTDYQKDAYDRLRKFGTEKDKNKVNKYANNKLGPAYVKKANKEAFKVAKAELKSSGGGPYSEKLTPEQKAAYNRIRQTGTARQKNQINKIANMKTDRGSKGSGRFGRLGGLGGLRMGGGGVPRVR